MNTNVLSSKYKLFASIIILLVALVMICGTTSDEIRPLTKAERMYDAILCYADSFDVPLYVAFNVATIETGYRGPLDSTYEHALVSPAGAVGPMQIMPRYASSFAGRPIQRQELKDSIELNVWLSMKILARHFAKYKDWKVAAGVYNTGKPIINKYAQKVANPNYFNTKWIRPVFNEFIVETKE